MPIERITKEQLKAALKAFKKRLKLMRLDAESKLNYGPTTSGKKSDIVAIMLPGEFAREVDWFLKAELA